MVTMTYTGKHRTVRRGPRVYNLKRGTYEVPVEDVAFLEELGATVKTTTDEPAEGSDDTPTADEQD